MRPGGGWMRRRIVAPALFLGALSVTGCSQASPSVTAQRSTPMSNVDAARLPSLSWSACDDPEVYDEDGLECATLTVPLNYAVPQGETIELALIRVPARSTRVGAIITNPGGPGSSGFDFIAFNGTFLRDEMRLDAFDIVGFDPRGVDRSGGLRCLTDAELDASMYLDYSPDSAEEAALLDAAPADFASECAAEYGTSLRHYSTANTARDMDAIRAALGDEQISYLGISYGTYLGGVYATLFPERVRAMVLDAAFDPVGDSVEESYSTQLVGFENAFDNWAEWCRDTPAECAFSTADVGAAWDDLFEQLDTDPVTATDGRLANQAVMDTATTAALYSESDWPLLGTALDQVREGDPAALFRLADGYVGRTDEGTYSTEQQSFSIISCASGFSSPAPDDPEALADELREKAPRFGDDITPDAVAGDDGCGTLTPGAEAVAIDYRGDAPVVVVGGENDPATPIRWAREMTASMGTAARLVSYTGEGHGFVLISRCVTEIEALVLTDLALPAEGTSCDPDPEVERPQWWDSLPTPDGVSPWRSDPAVMSALGIPPTFAYGQIAYTSLGAKPTSDAIDEVMSAAGFDLVGRQQPFEGVDQATYVAGNELVSVVIIEPTDLDHPDLEGLREVVAPGMTLVVQFYLPQ